MEDSIWKKIFKDSVFMINGYRYKLDDIITPTHDKSGKIECISVGFRPAASDNDSEIITVEIPMTAAFLFAKYLVSLKTVFGDLSSISRPLIEKLKDVSKTIAKELQKEKKGDK
jgi:hypothetical protein